MSQLFHSPKVAPMPQAPAPTPAPPTLDQAAANQTQENLVRGRRGAAASVLAGDNPSAPSSLGSPRLLGG